MDLNLLLVLRSENESFPFYQLSLLNPSLSSYTCFHVHSDTLLCCLLINTGSGKTKTHRLISVTTGKGNWRPLKQGMIQNQKAEIWGTIWSEWEGKASSPCLELVFVESLLCVSFLQHVVEAEFELHFGPFQSWELLYSLPLLWKKPSNGEIWSLIEPQDGFGVRRIEVFAVLTCK